MQKSYSIFEKTYNMTDYDSAPSDVDPEKWEKLLSQSKTYQELEYLIKAIAALAEWRAAEVEYTRNHQKQFSQSRAPADLRDAKAVVDECMEPVLEGILISPAEGDAEEAADLQRIRVDYIPEVVLAYNTVLHTAGSLISRQNLIASMDLSVKVAEERNGLAETFVKAKRMRELVTSFAMTSKAMLVLKDAGREWKPKRDREGKDLGMWETVNPEGMEEDEMLRPTSS
jgi:nuclear pore complex protein Nup107